MGWLHTDDENGTHEAWVVAVLSGGEDAPHDTFEESKEAWAQRVNWAWSFKYDGGEGRRRAQGLRVVCACGWRGPRRPVDFKDPDACDEGLHREWIRHAEVSLSRTPPERLRRLLDEVEEAVQALSAPLRPGGDLDEQRPLLAVYLATRLQNSSEEWQKEAVRVAKAADYSWDEIAQALRTTKQSAHEKFRKFVPAEQKKQEPAAQR
ncbi:hypothetical protein ACFVY0_42790 [Streptomyces sp. NPDC058286]|uniref:hypothetical protein n=1 Tax=Streptomyces sp. NPDC058286 TaxID=3346422 RepID=UPI0036EBB6ED